MRTCSPLSHLNLSGPAPVQGPFDESYVGRLRGGCALTSAHFADHFSRLLKVVLRRYVRRTDLIDDIRQETLLRILQMARRENFQPQRFEAFVLRTARLISYEMMRAERQYCAPEENAPEPADTRPTPEALAIGNAEARKASETLEGMEGRDGRILSMVFAAEADRTAICRQFGFSEAYLRVVLHRARIRFQEKASHPTKPRLRQAA